MAALYYLIGIIVGLWVYYNWANIGYGDRVNDVFAFFYCILVGTGFWPLFLLLIFYERRE